MVPLNARMHGFVSGIKTAGTELFFNPAEQQLLLDLPLENGADNLKRKEPRMPKQKDHGQVIFPQ